MSAAALERPFSFTSHAAALLLCDRVDEPVQYGLKPGSRYMFVNGKSLLDAAG